jgi:hypothetical protein
VIQAIQLNEGHALKQKGNDGVMLTAIETVLRDLVRYDTATKV